MEIKVLDHGFVRLIDWMGDDSSIVQAARVSYGEGTKTKREDAGLINYLWKHQHLSPFEMCEIKLHVKLPIFIARQWVRHRTACLTGDMQLVFDLPGSINSRHGFLRYPLTIKQVFNKFKKTKNSSRPDKQRNPYFKKERVQKMRLRSFDEAKHNIYHTNIADIWESGVKKIFKMTLENGKFLRCSKDHLILSQNGWKKLSEFKVGDFITVSGRKSYKKHNAPKQTYKNEIWGDFDGYEGLYKISNCGRVMNCKTNKIKATTLVGKTLFIGVSKNGKTRIKQVGRIVLTTFSRQPRPVDIMCHKNGNPLDCRIENLYWGTYKQNAADMVSHGTSTRVKANYSKITSITEDGEEMTYDVSVSGPYHNFLCNDIVVHNSINEYSGRYSVMKPEFYIPQQLLKQSSDNKQCSSPEEVKNSEILLNSVTKSCSDAYRLYEQLLEQGVSRELARIILPLNTYTEWYWKIDLRNLFNFLKLRLDKTASLEIQEYARAISEMVKLRCPLAYKAFEEGINEQGKD